MWLQTGLANYDEESNSLDVLRPGEGFTRRIPCYNIIPQNERVFGVQVSGDDIWVFVGPKNNPRPDARVRFQFSSLSGGGREYL
jgi:hypothetical protein